MPIPITIPRLGWNMEEGTFVEWLKQDGESVRPGDALFRLEGEKATEDVECFDTGILRIPADAPKPGDKIPVGAVIGYLLQPDESASVVEKNGESKTIHPPAPNEQSAPPVAASVRSAEPTIEAKPSRIAISPRARRVASQLDIDPAALHGTGKTGRIRERDVRALPSTEEKTIALSPIRKTIAERMVAAHHGTAPVTLTTTVDVTHLVALRNQFKAVRTGHETIPSYTDFFLKFIAIALEKHPQLNSSWAADRIVLHPEIHIGVAVDTEAGLLVPVLRRVDSLSVREIAVQAKERIERARAQRLTAADMEGGTFTVTNLGSFGIDAFTPIINAPQCAILGMGRIRRQPAVIDDKIVARDQMALSLTFDHRIIDGAPAARFVQTLTAMIENPGPWLMP